MAKRINFRKGLSSLLFWSIISAAFIGPGTVTTASKAGSAFGLDLMWAITFSILATILLQEAAARITIASGKSLGELIAEKYGSQRVKWMKMALFIAVAFGCMAYQAGNLLGSVSGILLVAPNGRALMLLGIGLLASVMLWQGKYRSIANVLGVVVALMGLMFIFVAINSNASAGEVASSIVIPTWNPDASLLIIGLIGTTIVPYNLFLASGISQGQDIREMRFGLILAIVIGGVISMAILVAGTQVEGEFTFQRLADALSGSLGSWASYFFAFGLFAAGFTSSITAPLAAAVTARSLFGQKEKQWQPRAQNFRMVWGTVLLVGLIFSLTNIKPIPAIIAAQAINGVLLPIIAIFLMLTVNDKKLLPAEFLNSRLINALMLLVLLVCCFLGINNVLKAAQQIGLFKGLSSTTAYMMVGGLTILIVGVVGWNIIRMRKE